LSFVVDEQAYSKSKQSQPEHLKQTNAGSLAKQKIVSILASNHSLTKYYIKVVSLQHYSPSEASDVPVSQAVLL